MTTGERRLREYGFWDYTTPGAGGMEHYGEDDYLWLLDDMAEAGMNSLVVVLKWMTTGYRSRLPYLDQQPANPAIASDNELIRLAIDESHKRGIKVWLGAVVTQYMPEFFGPTDHRKFTIYIDSEPRETAIYDLDMPGVAERSVEVFREIVELFPNADGLMVEVEGGDFFGQHRIEPYNRWAEENGKPTAKGDGVPAAFGDYTTYRRCAVLRDVERAARGAGFGGDLATICETIITDLACYQVVNLAEFAKTASDYAVVTYTYNRWMRRLSSADYCLVQPGEHGLRTYYLGRGVMTWNKEWRSPQPPMPMSLREQWAIDVEDVSRYQPDGFWWFGTGAVREGGHVDLGELKQMGFENGRDARKQLIEIGRSLRP